MHCTVDCLVCYLCTFVLSLALFLPSCLCDVECSNDDGWDDDDGCEIRRQNYERQILKVVTISITIAQCVVADTAEFLIIYLLEILESMDGWYCFVVGWS